MRPSFPRVIAASRVDARAERNVLAYVVLSPWTMLAIAIASLVVNATAIAIVFACVSAVALHEALPRARLWPFALVVVQFVLVAVGAHSLMATAVPLLAALALPLIAVCTRETADLANVCARRYFFVMLYVYALSYAPALVMKSGDGAWWLICATLFAIALGVLANKTRRIRRVLASEPGLLAIAPLCVCAPLFFYAM